MPAGILPESLRKTMFVLGIMMMTLAGAMEHMDFEAQTEAGQCAMNLKSEIVNYG